jgi:hypothetical protein
MPCYVSCSENFRLGPGDPIHSDVSGMSLPEVLLEVSNAEPARTVPLDDTTIGCGAVGLEVGIQLEERHGGAAVLRLGDDGASLHLGDECLGFEYQQALLAPSRKIPGDKLVVDLLHRV